MGRSTEEEVEMRMRETEREEARYTELLNNAETNMQVSDCCTNLSLHLPSVQRW